ncbi:MAG: DNA primase [Geminicoccaceae bacterium]|nr:DNA primase [Geminicoccaceae bacterium]
MALIPADVIETVRLRSDIVEVIASYVKLKKKGKRFIGSCPFHHEKDPSFTVTPDKQIFHCFGCGAGGDVFRFFMLKDNLTFPEAVEVLARRAGVSISSIGNPADLKLKQRSGRVREINRLTRDFYRHVLQRHEAAAAARQYLSGRELSPEVLERFQIGFALPGWNNLLDFMERRGFKRDELVEAGVVTKSADGRVYDRFRNRVIFPVWDAAANVTGFGGRVLDSSLPKYLNTPETPYFIKGHVLYGIHLARAAIREKGYAVIMEGYMDVITAHRSGITNAVASLGTSLTREQGKLLLNYTRNVFIAYDADAAGVAAAMRGMDLLQELGCDVRVVTVTGYKDPDEFIRGQGVDAWEKLIAGAPSLIEYKLRQAVAERSVLSATGKINVMRGVLPNLAALQSDIEKEESLKAVARALSLSWETVTGEFKRFEANQGKKWSNSDNIAKNKHNILGKEEKLDTRGKTEATLLRIVLEDPALCSLIWDRLGNSAFRNPQYQIIFKECLEAAKQPVYRPVELFNKLEDDEQRVLSMLLAQEIPGENLVEIMESYIDAIGRSNRRERRAGERRQGDGAVDRPERAAAHELDQCGGAHDGQHAVAGAVEHREKPEERRTGAGPREDRGAQDRQARRQ